MPLRDISFGLTETFQAMKGKMDSLKSMTKVCFPTVYPRIACFAANSFCTARGLPIVIFGLHPLLLLQKEKRVRVTFATPRIAGNRVGRKLVTAQHTVERETHV